MRCKGNAFFDTCKNYGSFFFRFIFDRCYDNEQNIMHNEQQAGSHFAGLQHVIFNPSL